ncbi:recombinase family protein [Metabacillus iocasae]|uniref:recombinase family protein n=1 Tax=Priestia iocasae TaxID=2291674 RepID=UPI0019639CE6
MPNERSEDIKYIFAEVVKGTTIPDLLRKLKSMEMKTRQGYDFKYNSIQRIITNEACKGTIISNRTIDRYSKIFDQKKSGLLFIMHTHL